MASMPVPRIVLERLIDALATVALCSSWNSQVESWVELVSKGLCSSSEAPTSENTDSAGIEEIEDADVSFSIMVWYFVIYKEKKEETL